MSHLAHNAAHSGAVRANERSERPSGPFKTRLSLTKNAPLGTLTSQLPVVSPNDNDNVIDLDNDCDM